MFLETMKQFLNVVGKSVFLSTLLAGLLAGFTVATLFSIILPRYLEWLTRPNIKFFFRKYTRDDFLELSRKDDGTREGVLHIAIRNKGKATLKSYYYHLIFPSEVNPQLRSINSDQVPSKEDIGEDGKRYIQWRGFIKEPLFPKRNFVLPFEIAVNVREGNGPWTIYYWISTEFGMSPKAAEGMEKRAKETLPHLGRLLLK